MVPISGGGGFGFSGVAGVEYLTNMASVGRAEKFILLRLDRRSVMLCKALSVPSYSGSPSAPANCDLKSSREIRTSSSASS